MPYLPPARGRARKACRRISRSTRCRPHSTPSASRSRQTRRALGRVRRSVISHYHLLLSRSLQQWSLRCIASLRLTAAWYESGSRGTSGDTSSRIGTSHAGATGVAGRRLPDIRDLVRPLSPIPSQQSCCPYRRQRRFSQISVGKWVRQRSSNANKKSGQRHPMDNESSERADTIRLSNADMILLDAAPMISNRCDG